MRMLLLAALLSLPVAVPRIIPANRLPAITFFR